MRLEVDANQITGLPNNNPGGSVSYRENPVIGVNPIVTDKLLEPVRYFLGKEGNLRFLYALRVPDGSFPVLDILGSEF